MRAFLGIEVSRGKTTSGILLRGKAFRSSVKFRLKRGEEGVYSELSDVAHAIVDSVRMAIDKAGIRPEDVKAVGVSAESKCLAFWSSGSLSSGIVVFGPPEVPMGELASGNLCGPLGCWTVWFLTGGKVWAADPASLSTLKGLKVPAAIEPKDSFSDYGNIDPEVALGYPAPITFLSTLEGSSFLLTGATAPGTVHVSLARRISVQIITEGEGFEKGLEPMVFLTGAGIDLRGVQGDILYAEGFLEWLEEGLGIVGSVVEAGLFAKSVGDSGGIVVIPAFGGIGAPFWVKPACGAIFGITPETRREHILRAAFEAVAFRIRDVTSLVPSTVIYADGAGCEVDFLLQKIADATSLKVIRRTHTVDTSVGAAFGAMISCGYATVESADEINPIEAEFVPAENLEERYRRWRRYLEDYMEDLRSGRYS